MNTEERLTYLKQLTRTGDVRSMLALGELYEEIREDNTLAMKMYYMAYRKAKDNYWKEIAAAYMASHYLDSSDSGDWQKASSIIHSVIRSGAFFAPSVYLIGDMQQYGKEYRQRDHSAYESYLVAMELVYTTEENRRFIGQTLLRYGEIYSTGLYVPVDTDKAHAYYTEAETILKAQAEKHDVFAMRALKRLKLNTAFHYKK